MASYRLPAPTSMAFYGRPSLPFARPKTLQTPKTPKTLNPKTPKRPLRRSSVPLASNRPSLSMAFYGRPSLPFASLKTLQTATTPPSSLPWLLMGFQRRQKLPQGQIHCCFWAVQRAVRQAFAANGHPKATSMASSGLPAASKLAVCQA